MGLNYTKNLIHSASERSRFYTTMGGVDFSRDPSEISRERFSELENMYRDYEGEGTGLVESVPGFRILQRLGESIRGLYLQKRSGGEEYLLLATDTSLYRLPISERDNSEALVYVGALPEGRIVGFPFGEAFYFIGGERMLRLSGEGELRYIGEGADEEMPYIPTTYRNGSAYEQRNLLSSRFYESTVMERADDYSAKSNGLLFEVTDEGALSCALCGRTSREENELLVPASVQIGNKIYTVTSVKKNAFADDTSLRSVVFSEGMREISTFAFLRCASLETVVLSDTVTSIGTGAFDYCSSLTHLHFGEGYEQATVNYLDFCTSLHTLDFAISESLYLSRFPTDPFRGYEKRFLAQNYFLNVDLPVLSHTKNILSLTRDGEEIPFVPILNEGGEVRYVRITMEDKRTFHGAELTLLGEYAPSDGEGVFLPDTESDRNAPLGAGVCELFDGRIFLSGAPLYPNTVFYTQRDLTGQTNPTYFGVYNHFEDGMGTFAVNALLSVGNTLAVFKENDDGSGSIFYHTPKETGDDIVPKIYPVTHIHSGLVGLGSVISYYDEPIFISESGICTLYKSAMSAERTVKVRSHRIHPRLLSERLDSISLAKWCGYLVACVGGRIFLADYRQLSRDGINEEYEWYYLTGIGTYTGDETVYRYHPAPAPYYKSAMADEVTERTVYSEIAPDGKLHYFVKPAETKYEVYPTEERRGGVFSPAKQVFASGKLLFFTTESGDLCLFNNDKRGVAPDTLTFENEAEKRDFEKNLGSRLHRSFYSFAGHAPHYALSTKADNCDIPHLEKDGVRGSLSIRCRTDGNGENTLSLKTNRERVEATFDARGVPFDFNDMDFSAIQFSGEDFTTFAHPLRAQKFVEKEISLTSDAFASPIAISSIAYRYSIRGKIKNR